MAVGGYEETSVEADTKTADAGGRVMTVMRGSARDAFAAAAAAAVGGGRSGDGADDAIAIRVCGLLLRCCRRMKKRKLLGRRRLAAVVPIGHSDSRSSSSTEIVLR